MLGLLKPKIDWKWAACGKHPAAKDYFAFRVATPLMKAFSEWVERGYRDFTGSNKKAFGQSSWRFWSRGTRKGELLCGLLKDSSDGIGRPYPLLVMGSGVIKGWENGWASLFQALSSVWNQMEHISSRRFDHLNQLEVEVGNLPNPAPNERGPKPAQETGLQEKQTARQKALQLTDNGELWLALDGCSAADPTSAVQVWGALLADQGIETPNALFMGGIPERLALALYKRSLNAGDFTRLWSLADVEEP